jgi:ABC-2 type transport system ATP-binding protein
MVRPRMATSLFRLSEVGKRYGAHQALRGLTFEVPTGSIGLLGPNGAGKSTLLKVLLGLFPFDGDATVLGLDPRRQATELRARIGYVPEGEALFPEMNAVESCIYAGELSGLPRPWAIKRAHLLLDFVGLGDKRYQPASGYSTGMKQRLKLAGALVHGPDLVLLDEPTNGLDPTGRRELLDLIKSLHERTGASVLLSSHLLPDIEAVCDHVVMLHEGSLLSNAPLTTMKRASERPLYEVRLKEDDERLLSLLSARGIAVHTNGASGSLLLVETPLGEPRPTALLFALAEEAKVQIRHLRPRSLTLEDAFLEAVGTARKNGHGHG